jgi:uncharacterized membrane protein YraQ (UPF0718 family)/YHS domain-containing protein
MLWATFWPLVLGFSLSGAVQAFVPRGGLARALGEDRPGTLGRAALLGALSSSCSYAASAMGRALFSRGASFTNATAFMVASTNLVVELGVVLYVLLGWQFLVAELLGGLVMVALLGAVVPRLFPAGRAAALRTRVGAEGPSDDDAAAAPGSRDGWSRAARYAWGDVTMLRRELVIGFLVAGFLAADVPGSWWRVVFVTGHGWWTVLEDAVVAPLVAVASFVCSVGNIPLAASLWAHGVAFGGVVAFIFADLVTLPLLLIYRRFYGGANALRLFGALWLAMSLAGLAVDLVASAAHVVPTARSAVVTSGHFALGATLGLNLAALLVVGTGAWLVRRPVVDDTVAIDPVCGMQVRRAGAAATATHGSVTYYFCAPRCAERFSASPERFLGEIAAPVSPPSQPITLNRKRPSD